jgi:hypothetical protein
LGLAGIALVAVYISAVWLSVGLWVGRRQEQFSLRASESVPLTAS